MSSPMLATSMPSQCLQRWTNRTAKMPKVLITGARGKCGKRATEAFQASGYTVVGTDIGGPINFDTPLPGECKYVVADLQDAGQVFALISFEKPDAVVHIAAIPEPYHHPNHVVFQNNIMATFNIIEACVRCGVKSLVNISSETVPGFFFPEIPFDPPECPIDEKSPVAPQDPYALAKHFGEQLCDAAVRRCPGMSVVTIRPSWVQTPETIARNLGPHVREAGIFQPGMWAYIWVADLAEAMVLAVHAVFKGSPVFPGSHLASRYPTAPPAGSLHGKHEVVYIAAADNAGGRDLRTAVAAQYAGRVPVKPLARVDASGISCAKAKALLGWESKTHWADWLDAKGEKKQQ